MEKPIVNKVAQSPLVNLSLDEFYPKGVRVIIDLKDYLEQGLVLREKEFRKRLKETDWKVFKDQYTGIHCSTDAIIPIWAFMLLASCLKPFAKKVAFGDREALETAIFHDALNTINLELYRDKPVLLNGCGKTPIPVSAFVEVTEKLLPVVKSLMFGEACSSVPVYKKQ